ncbi:MAG: hypothetical protein RL030_1709 [Pseudomonadota bacterium]
MNRMLAGGLMPAFRPSRTHARTRLAIAIGLAMAGTGPAWSAAATAEDTLEEVTVTGSRIQHAVGMSTPTPVAALSSTELTAMAPASIVEALTQLPQFYGSATDANFNTGTNGFFGTPGGGSLNLRGVGTKRTLTLLNGRRVVPASIFGGPDINMFPEALLARVETVTGGASAAYGTDAVSGVVNYILDTNFTGFEGRAQYGMTERSDGNNSEFALTFGDDIGERFHLLVSASHSKQDSIETIEDREWYQGWALMTNPATGAGTTTPRYLRLPDVLSTAATFDGVIQAWQSATGNTQLTNTGNALGAAVAGPGRMVFDASGNASAFVYGTPQSTATGLAHYGGNGGSGTDYNTDRYNLLPESERNSAFLYLNFDLTENTDLFVQGMYSDQTLTAVNVGGAFTSQGSPTFSVFRDNAYLPAALRTTMTNSNIGSFTFGRMGHSLDLAGAGAYVEQTTEVLSATAGFQTRMDSEGFMKDWTLDGYYQYGKSDVDAAQQGGIRLDRIYLAVDAVVDPATGRTVCNVTLRSGRYPDCVPLNLFGRGQASQAAVDWVTGFDPGVPVTTTPYLPGFPPETYSYVGDEYKHRLIDLTQHVFEVSANGPLFDGWAGVISGAVGAHYRKESVDQRLQASQGNPAGDPSVRPVAATNGVQGIRGVAAGSSANSTEFQFSRVPFVRGSYDIKEVFGETLVPLYSGDSWLRSSNFSGALRWADYAGSGSIWSYKVGLDAAMAGGVRLRGTYSRDVRAAGMNERFDRTGGAGNVTDYGLAGTPTYGVTTTSQGNPTVKPESADTFTAGVVYQPGWLTGFDMSVDWFSVSLQDAIERYTAGDIVDRCYRGGQTDLCAYIQPRDPVTGRILFVTLEYLNLNEAKVSGVDIEMGYSHATSMLSDNERVGARLFGSWLGENSQTTYNGVKTDLAGVAGVQLPRWKVTGNLNYTAGPFSAFVQGRFIGAGRLGSLYNFTNPTTGIYSYDVESNRVGSVTYVDARFGYTFDMGEGTVELFGNVSNLLDRDPPVIPSPIGGLTSSATQYTTAYDYLGRRYTLGVNVKF